MTDLPLVPPAIPRDSRGSRPTARIVVLRHTQRCCTPTTRDMDGRAAPPTGGKNPPATVGHQRLAKPHGRPAPVGTMMGKDRRRGAKDSMNDCRTGDDGRSGQPGAGSFDASKVQERARAQRLIVARLRDGDAWTATGLEAHEMTNLPPRPEHQGTGSGCSPATSHAQLASVAVRQTKRRPNPMRSRSS